MSALQRERERHDPDAAWKRRALLEAPGEGDILHTLQRRQQALADEQAFVTEIVEAMLESDRAEDEAGPS